ncbi:MAG: glycosyltransferase family 4 protein [Planctomycetota bacterium]
MSVEAGYFVLVAGVAAAVIAGVITSLMVPLVAWAAQALHAMDDPGGRKEHRRPVPRLGGIAVAVGLAFGAGSVGLVQWGEWGGRLAKTDLVALVVALAMVFLLGLADDLMGVSVWKKFLVQFAAAGLIVGVGWRFTVLGVPGLKELDLGACSVCISVLWIVGVTNAINLIDGLDGLASGVIAIIAGSFMVYSVLQRNFFTVVLMGAVVGACLGFLRHNWAPAKIFLGDAGSLSLGFLLAATSVHSSIKAPAAVAILVPLLALGVPVIDTLLVMWLRFLSRGHGPLTERFLAMFRADRNHLHHLLGAWAGRRGRVVTTIYLIVLLSCVAALTVALTKSATQAAILLAVEVGAIVLIRQWGLAARARTIVQEKKTEVKERIRESGEQAAMRGIER